MRTSLAAAVMAWRAGRRSAVAMLVMSVVGGVAPVATGVSTKVLLDALSTGAAGVGRYALPTAGLLLGGAAAAVLPGLSAHVDAAWGRSITIMAQSRLHAAIGRLQGLRRLEQPAFRDRLRLAEESGRSDPQVIVSGGLDVARSLLTVIGFMVTLVSLNPWLAALVVAGCVPAVREEFTQSRRRIAAAWTLSPAERRQVFYSDLITGLPAAKEVRLFGLGALFGARMLAEMRHINEQNHRLDVRDVRAQAALAGVGTVIVGAGLVWAVSAAVAGRLGIGDVALFLAAVVGVQGAAATAVGRVAVVHRSTAMFGNYLATVDVEPDIADPVTPCAVAPLRQGLELDDVWFRYDPRTPWVLRGVTVNVPCGRTVALVGLNGAGKSTLVKLLLRFYDPDRGRILWDGVDIRSVPVADLRERVSAVFQDFMCYDLTAAENVGVGVVGSMDDRPRIAAAARMAGADAVIGALPRGYDTPLTRLFVDSTDGAGPDTGVLLSGGQWQRVALARFFLRSDADLLILDEPSAGLDAEAEAEIHHRLHTLRAGRTAILISHRLSAVRDADLIVVLRDGRVVETGSHTDLVAAGGRYARLFALQAAGYRGG